MDNFIKSLVLNYPQFRSVHFLALSLLLCCLSYPAFAQAISANNAQQAPIELKLNAAVERELKGGATHSYTIALEANQFLHLAVDQRGIDVVVRLFSPEAKKIAEVDSPNEYRATNRFH